MRPRIIHYMILIGLMSLAACQTSPEPKPTPFANQTPVSTIIVPTPTSSAATQPGSTDEVEQAAAGPGSSLTDTQHGVSITLTHMEFLEKETKIKFKAEVDPIWGFTFGRYDVPPQQVYVTGELSFMSLKDETGKSYEPRHYSGGNYAANKIDPQTQVAITGGNFVFEPAGGKVLTLKFTIALLTVRANEAIRYGPLDVSRDYPLTLEQDFKFGEISTSIEAASWRDGNTLEIDLENMERNGLKLMCIYLFTNPSLMAEGYEGCFPYNLNGHIVLNPFPDPSQPPPVYIAADIQFTEPFEFTWVRTDVP